MMKLFIGNKAYSSWSLRGWLACKLSALPFEEVVVPLYDEAWEKRREGDEFAPSSGKVPILWDGDDIVVWDSLAIVEYLNEKSGGTLFWPADPAARAMARSMAAEMHSSFAALRREHSMNIRQIYPAVPPSDAVAQDIARLMQLWAQARARHGGDGEFLFGHSARRTSCSRPSSRASSPINCPSPALRRPICTRSSRIPGCRNGSAARRPKTG